MTLQLLLLAFALTQLLLIGWSFRWGNNQSLRIWLLRALLFGMGYDNFVQALGNNFIDADWYYPANVIRFVLHAGVLPFLTLFSLSIMQAAQVKIAQHRLTIIGCYLFTVCTLSYGLYHEVFMLELGPKVTMGIQKLSSLSTIPPIATILTNIIFLPIAAAVWKRDGWPWFFVGGLFIFIVNGATATQPWGFISGNFAEVVFISCLLFTDKHYSNR